MNETPQFLPPRGPQDIFPGDPCEEILYSDGRFIPAGFILEVLDWKRDSVYVAVASKINEIWGVRAVPLDCLRVPSWRVVPAVDRGSRWPQDLLPSELEALRTIATGASPEAEACLGIIKRLTGVEIRPRDQKEETDPR